MTEAQYRDSLLSVAEQLATVSAPLMRELGDLKAFGALDSLRLSMARVTLLNDSLLTSAQGLLTSQSQVSLGSSRIAQIVDANLSLESLVSKIGLSEAALSINVADQLGLGNLAALSAASTPIAASYLKLGASINFAASLAAQEKMTAMQCLPIGGLLNSDTTFRRSASAHLGRMTRSYGILMSTAKSSASLTDYLPTIATLPPVDYYRHVAAIEAITVPAECEQDAESIDESFARGAPTVDDLLKQLDGSLCPLLTGARQSALSNNPERPRHVTTSLRELVTQVLHILAPDADVSSWTSSAEHFQNGHPTRRARLLFICRDINSGPFETFVEADVSAALALVDSLSAGTHTVSSQLTPTQLRSMVVRIESLLVFLLGVGQLH